MHALHPPTATPLPPAHAWRRRWLQPGVLISLLLATALTVVIVARQAPSAPDAAAPAAHERAQVRTLRFIDQPDGSVAAIEDGSGQVLHRFEGEQGFLRGTLRAMVRERRMRGIGAGQAFELILHHDGRLTLYDPSTGTRIALESFGPDNTRVFARLLD